MNQSDIGALRVDPKPFTAMAARRAADDPEAALRLVVDHEPVPEPIGAPVPGAMAVLAITAFLVSVVLAVAKVFGMGISILWVLAPMWGSALAVAAIAMACAIPAAVGDAKAWVRRGGQ